MDSWKVCVLERDNSECAVIGEEVGMDQVLLGLGREGMMETSEWEM